MSQKTTLFWLAFFLVIGAVALGIYSYVYKGPATSGGQLKLLVAVSPTDHSTGSSTAPVTIVEYADFQCPSCQSYAPLLTQLIKEEADKVYFVYRYFPLPQHPNAEPAAYAAEAAGLQGKFWEMHDLLYQKHTEWETLTDAKPIFLTYAQTIGLDAEQFTKDMDSSAVKDRVAKDKADAATNQLTYTPTLFVNGIRVVNPQSYAALKQMVEDTASTTAHTGQ